MTIHLPRPGWWLLICILVLPGCGSSGSGGSSTPLSSNAQLADLILSVVGFDQPFDADQTNYTATVDFTATSATVTATTRDGSATLTVNGNAATSGVATPAIDLSVGENVLTVVVTAENGTTNRTYTITLIRRANPQPADMTGLRSFDGGSNVLLLSFAAVKPSAEIEDRTIAHYDIIGLSGVQPTSFLNIPVSNIDPLPPGGIFEVYSFAGDGVVSIDEWAVGTLFHTFSNIEGGESTLQVDITSLLQSAVDSGDNYLSFNFRAGAGTDRFWLGSIVFLDDPTISSIPAIGTDLIFDWEGAGASGSIGSLIIANSSSTFPFDFDTRVVVFFDLSFSNAFDDFVFGPAFDGFSASGHIELTAGGTPELVDLDLIAPGVAADGESVQLSMGFESPAGSFLVVTSSIGGVLASHFGVWSIREPTTLVIAIKPSSDPNSINPVTVAILSTNTASDESIDFDAIQVDATTVTFGPDGAGIAHSQAHVEDVDGDGDSDLVLHFKTQETGISCGDTEATLTGETFGGQAITGTDAVKTSGCK